VDYADLAIGSLPRGTADAYISMGGPMSANDNLPWLKREMDILERAAAEGIPVLGVCLGSQLIARALGARVFRNPEKEIGWHPVHWTPAAARDPLFNSLADPEMLFHWHGETFDLPTGAEWLAWSHRCRHQAFRCGRHVYGLQFHLEVTAHMITGWCKEDVNQGDMREVHTPIDPDAYAASLARLTQTVFGRWCDLVEACHHGKAANA